MQAPSSLLLLDKVSYVESLYFTFVNWNDIFSARPISKHKMTAAGVVQRVAEMAADSFEVGK